MRNYQRNSIFCNSSKDKKIYCIFIFVRWPLYKLDVANERCQKVNKK